jgi:pyrroloquinoline quinone biosynthesis protein B
VNASPDVRDQLARASALHPKPGTRDVPLDTVLVTNADLDHVLGLLVMREALPYRIVSTHWVREALLSHNTVFRILEPAWGVVGLDEPVRLDREGRLEAKLFPVPGKVPGHLQALAANHPEATVGVRVTDVESGRRVVIVPGARSLDAGVVAELAAAAAGFVDGTFFTDRELAVSRPGAPGAREMGHVPISGSEGSLVRLAGLPGRIFYTHVNNTNPVLDSGSKERALVRAAGIDVAYDGMELEP